MQSKTRKYKAGYDSRVDTNRWSKLSNVHVANPPWLCSPKRSSNQSSKSHHQKEKKSALSIHSYIIAIISNLLLQWSLDCIAQDGDNATLDREKKKPRVAGTKALTTGWLSTASATVSIRRTRCTPGMYFRCHPMPSILSIVSPSSRSTHSMLAAPKHFSLTASRPIDSRCALSASSLGSTPYISPSSSRLLWSHTKRKEHVNQSYKHWCHLQFPYQKMFTNRQASTRSSPWLWARRRDVKCEILSS